MKHGRIYKSNTVIAVKREHIRTLCEPYVCADNALAQMPRHFPRSLAALLIQPILKRPNTLKNSFVTHAILALYIDCEQHEFMRVTTRPMGSTTLGRNVVHPDGSPRSNAGRHFLPSDVLFYVVGRG